MNRLLNGRRHAASLDDHEAVFPSIQRRDVSKAPLTKRNLLPLVDCRGKQSLLAPACCRKMDGVKPTKAGQPSCKRVGDVRETRGRSDRSGKLAAVHFRSANE